MKQKEVPFDQHIFVCTNGGDQDDGCCGGRNGQTIFKALRTIAKEEGVHPRIRVAQAKCLGKCDEGVNVFIVPDQIWYHDVQIEDVQHLANQYLRGRGQKHELI